MADDDEDRLPEASPEAVMMLFAAAGKACDAAGKGAELRDGLGRFATGAGVSNSGLRPEQRRPDPVRWDHVACELPR